MQEESKQRRMNMDFSQLHTYTPPQCAPENTGYTYSLSSSYSTAALEFEKEHQIAPVYESPRMSRRSLRLQTSAGHYGNESLADYSQNRSSSYTSTRRETRTLRSRKQQSSSNSLSLSLSQAATPKKTLSFSAANTPINSSSNFQQSSTASDASELTAFLDEPHLRQRTITTTTTTTSVDGHWGQSSSHSLSSVNGDASTSKSHTTLSNGFICRDCSLHSQKMDSFVTRSSSSLSSSSQAAETSTDALSSSSSPFTSIYSRDRSRRNKTAHSSFCGSMNVKDLVTEDASHLNLNGSLCDDCKGKQVSETHTVLQAEDFCGFLQQDGISWCLSCLSSMSSF